MADDQKPAAMSKAQAGSSIYKSAAGEREVQQRYRDLLDQWPVPCELLRVPTREGETFVVACGPQGAPPVLAMQGSGANSAMWMPQIEALAGHLRLYAVDVIGEPGLSAPSRPPFDSDAYALWLDDVMAGLDLTRVAMMGVSSGGWLALDYAMRRPEQVARLALLSPGGVGRRKTGMLFKASPLLSLGHWGRRKALTLALGSESRATARGNGSSRDLARDTAMFDLVLFIFKHFKPRMQAQPIFADAALKGLAMPVLAIVGGRDAMLDSQETKRRLEALVSQAMVHLIPEVGHLLPDQSATLLDFLGNPHESGSDG